MRSYAINTCRDPAGACQAFGLTEACDVLNESRAFTPRRDINLTTAILK